MSTPNNFPPTNAVSAQTFAAGQKILNRYTLERVLGQGGMGVVWLAQDEELDRKVALKFLPTLVINDRSSLNDLKRETRRSLELTHPNIVRTYDFLQDATLAGISMEYVDSDTLRNRRLNQPSGVFQPADLGPWIVQLCDALDYAHQHAAIVHRDLKPANLLINTRNHLKVADFGISRSIVESVTQVTGNVSSGTLVYMSPQQLDGDPAQPPDDIYAVGATLYELCASRPPFYTGDVYRQVHAKVAPTIAARRAELGLPHGEVPENWETTVAACLAKDPAQRPQSAGEIAVRLGLREAASITVATATRASVPPPLPTVSTTTASTANPFNPPTAATATGPVFPVTPSPLPAAVPMGLRGKRLPVVPLAAAAGVLALIGVVWLVGSHSGKGTTKNSGVAHDNSPKAPETAAPGYSDEYSGQPSGVPSAGPSSGAHGGIFVETDPPGALVSVDGRPAEMTPTSLKDLAPGAHSLRVTMDGFDDYASSVDVKENQPSPVAKIKLAHSTGRLAVTTNPAGADFTVNGPDSPAGGLHGTSPWNSDKLPVGDYEITINRVGAAPFTKKVSLTKDGTVPVAFDLTAGTVQIESNPPGATVVFEAKPLGQTPLTLNEVPPGNVQYSLAAAGYPNVSVQGLVEPGQVLQLNATFTKADAAPPGPAPAPDRKTASNTTRTRQRHGGRGGDDDDNDNHRHGDTFDKANRAADLMNKLRWMGGRFPHP